MKNKIKYIICITAIALLPVFSGCVKEKKSSATATALLGLHMHTFIADSMVDPGALNVYIPDSNGRVEKLNHAQFYITNVSVHSTTTGWYTIPNSLILKREENEEYVIGNVPAGNYDDVRFTVGLGAALNSGSPSTYTSAHDSVLSTLESSMYFGPNQGYKFMSVAGVVDTSANHSGTNLIPFSYDLGGTGDTANITLPQQAFSLLPSAAVANNVQFIHINCDFGYLLQNAAVVTDPNARIGSTYGTAQQMSIATQIWNRILGMFRYECSTPNGIC